jgi:cystathionine beta-lyase
VFTGTLHSLEVAMEFETDPGDGVVVFSPIYHPFTAAIRDSGRHIVDVPLDGPDYRLDAERFEAALDPTTKVVLWCHPHNPLGRVFDHDEIAAFADVAQRHDLLVISDEVWGDLTHGVEHLPLYREAPALRSRLVTLSSASKAFNIAGLRCSLAHIGDAGIRDQMAGYAMHFFGGPSNVASAATIAAWQHGGPWLDKIKAQLTANRDHLTSRVNALPGVAMQAPEATYLAWLDFTDSVIADDPAGRLYETGRIALHNGDKFSPLAGSFVRVNFATSPQILDELIDRMAHTLEEHS